MCENALQISDVCVTAPHVTQITRVRLFILIAATVLWHDRAVSG